MLVHGPLVRFLDPHLVGTVELAGCRLNIGILEATGGQEVRKYVLIPFVFLRSLFDNRRLLQSILLPLGQTLKGLVQYS